MEKHSNSFKENGQNIFNIRPAAVKKWVDELPLGSTGESSKQIYHALKKVNQQHNLLEHHLDFLQTITPTLILLYPRLSKYFTDVSLPLTTKTRNVIHITNSLLTEILLSYRTIIKTLSSEKPFAWKKSFALALHHSFIFNSQVLSTQRLTYQPTSKGTWHNIFWCYQQADRFKILNKSFYSYANNNQKTSIDYEFKRLLLLSLLSANDLGQRNIREVQNLMPLCIKKSDILSNQPDDKKTCFTLNLLSDAPPYLIGTRNDKSKQTIDRHYLSTNKLKKTLAAYLNKADRQGGIKIGKNILSKSTLQSLLNCWSRSNVRTIMRNKGTGFVDIITGITATHYVLSQEDQPNHDEGSVNHPDDIIDFESTLTIEPLKHNVNKDALSQDHFLAKKDQKDDVWGGVFENNINTSIAEAHWTKRDTHKTFNFNKSILLDQSKNGYCLSVNSKKIDTLKHNELVAIREHTLSPWVLTQTKWLHFSEKGDLQFGLHVLSRHVLPAQVCYKANNNLSKPLPCLLGLDREKLILFVPTLPTNLNGEMLQLDHQNKISHIHLKNKILSTSAFDAYEILETHNNDTASSDVNLISKRKEENIWGNF